MPPCLTRPLLGGGDERRGAKGVRLVNLEPGDKLLAIARVVESDEEEASNSNPPMETPPPTAPAP